MLLAGNSEHSEYKYKFLAFLKLFFLRNIYSVCVVTLEVVLARTELKYMYVPKVCAHSIHSSCSPTH